MLNTLIALLSPVNMEMTLDEATSLVARSQDKVSKLVKAFNTSVDAYLLGVSQNWDNFVQAEGDEDMASNLARAKRNGLRSCATAYQKLCKFQQDQGLLVVWSKEDWDQENLSRQELH